MKTMHPSQPDQPQELEFLLNEQIGQAHLTNDWQNRVKSHLQQVQQTESKTQLNRNVIFLLAGLILLNSGLLYYSTQLQKSSISARENELRLLSKELFINPT